MAKVTVIDLITSAQSSDMEECKRAHEMYRNWVRLAPQLAPQDRLSGTERVVLEQMFARKGLSSRA